MAAISRRPRLKACALFAVFLLAVGCSLMNSVETPADKQTRAQHLAQGGQHAQAAQLFAELAAQASPERDSYLLQSAQQWLAGGNVAEAKQALSQVSGDARSRYPTLRGLVVARLALVEKNGARAIQELDQIAIPTVPDQAQEYWAIRGDSAFLTGHPLEGVRAFVEREHWLDPKTVPAGREELYGRIRAAAERGTSLKPPSKTDPIVAGWLALGPVAVELARDPMRAAAVLANWKRLFPTHPANEGVLALVQTQLSVETKFPDQIALLLPLSGRSEPVGIAVRDGFIAAYLRQDAALRPRLKIYDVAAESVGTLYNRAMDEGAGFVVGPLTKEDVAAVAPLTAGHTPVLALNFLSESLSAAPNLYQFALLPEDEARSVARRVVADGKLKGVAILPTNELGTRVGAAFVEELARLGGTLLDREQYETSRADFSDIIRRSLQIHAIKGEPSTHRSDVDFIFFVGSPGAARLMMPQLKFHYAGDVPVYCTSESFEPNSNANQDLDGLNFSDMPWMIASDSVTSQIRDEVRASWPTRTTRRDRLYAFGFDAYRLVPALRSKSLSETHDIAGVTGKLHLDDHNRIRRELEWARIKNGVPLQM